MSLESTVVVPCSMLDIMRACGTRTACLDGRWVTLDRRLGFVYVDEGMPSVKGAFLLEHVGTRAAEYTFHPAAGAEISSILLPGGAVYESASAATQVERLKDGLESIRAAKAMADIRDVFRRLFSAGAEAAQDSAGAAYRRALGIIERGRRGLRVSEEEFNLLKNLFYGAASGKEGSSGEAEEGKVRGRSDSLAVSTGDEPIFYQIWELDRLVPSHDPESQFAKRKDYPDGVQERQYHSDKGEQEKVLRNAASLDPRYLVNTNPDAMSGPPVIDSKGVVLGGNSRTMSIQMAYSGGSKKGQAYREAVIDAAASFGCDPEAVARMKKPVLVRVVEREMSREEMAQASRRLNETTTQALQADAEGVSKSRLLADPDNSDVLAAFAADSEEFSSLSEYLASSKSLDFVQGLIRSGVIEKTQASRLTDKDTGLLNAEGRRLASYTLRGLVVQDADVISRAPQSVLEKIDKAIPSLVSLRGRKGGWGEIVPCVQNAVNQISRWLASGTDTNPHTLSNIRFHFDQGSLYTADPEKDNPAVQALAIALASMSQTEFKARMALFEAEAKHSAKTGSMAFALGGADKPLSPQEAFLKAFSKPVALANGAPVRGFAPQKNAKHEALQWASDNSGREHTVEAAMKKLGAVVEDEKASPEEKEEAKERMSLLSGYSGKVYVYGAPNLGAFWSRLQQAPSGWLGGGSRPKAKSVFESSGNASGSSAAMLASAAREIATAKTMQDIRGVFVGLFGMAGSRFQHRAGYLHEVRDAQSFANGLADELSRLQDDDDFVAYAANAIMMFRSNGKEGIFLSHDSSTSSLIDRLLSKRQEYKPDKRYSNQYIDSIRDEIRSWINYDIAIDDIPNIADEDRKVLDMLSSESSSLIDAVYVAEEHAKKTEDGRVATIIKRRLADPTIQEAVKHLYIEHGKQKLSDIISKSCDSNKLTKTINDYKLLSSYLADTKARLTALDKKIRRKAKRNGVFIESEELYQARREWERQNAEYNEKVKEYGKILKEAETDIAPLMEKIHSALKNESNITDEDASKWAESVNISETAEALMSKNVKENIRSILFDFYKITNGKSGTTVFRAPSEYPFKKYRNGYGRSFSFGPGVFLFKGEPKSVVYHELSHVLETTNTAISMASSSFITKRATGDSIGLGVLDKRQGASKSGYASHEKGFPDSFADIYIGKDYGEGKGVLNRHHEVLSMGVQMLADPKLFCKCLGRDREYVELILGMLSMDRPKGSKEAGNA